MAMEGQRDTKNAALIPSVRTLADSKLRVDLFRGSASWNSIGSPNTSRVNLRNFKLLLEENHNLEQRIKKLESFVKILSSLFSESKPLTQSVVQKLVLEISKQPKLIEEEALRLSQDLNQKLQRVEILLSKIERQIFG
ncbi:hypothetical protein C4D60_Mb00t02060 [Musa balbisiana]|uniref:Uncharacterized protein n=1 Tax=Musa balbisiana TaxID=52838 RepID=A0A4V6T3X6_MUSBA|nr:hypothetical protein C4D60_Mb00t02060 [Musa balbisiana]